jgi:DNA-binding PadR family transcriptional regulator
VNDAPSTLEFFLLSQLLLEPCSGYELRKSILSSPITHFSDSPGSIYPALRRLVKRNWIAPSLATGRLGHSKTVYKVMPLGEEEIRRWLQTKISGNDVAGHLDELMLRFAVIDRVLGREESLQFLNSLQTNVEGYVEELRARLERGNELTGNARLAMEHGLMGYEATRLWTNRALRRMESELPRSAGNA